jgi:hypothetical protein
LLFVPTIFDRILPGLTWACGVNGSTDFRAHLALSGRGGRRQEPQILKGCPTNFSDTRRIRSEYQKEIKPVARRILAVGFVLPLLLADQAKAARPIVTIQGTRDADGYLYVALFSTPDGFPDGNFSDRHMKLKAAPEPVSVVFDDLAPGIYAVGTDHDETITAVWTPISSGIRKKATRCRMGSAPCSAVLGSSMPVFLSAVKMPT